MNILKFVVLLFLLIPVISSANSTISGGTELKIYHLPINYDFKPFYKDLNFYVNDSVGYAEIKKRVTLLIHMMKYLFKDKKIRLMSIY